MRERSLFVNGQEKLIYMANQIARNFAAMKHDDAVAAVADHINMFWDPRMKAKIFADGTGLNDVATAAIERLRRGAEPEHQTPATKFDGHSDAG